ncbi:hypothetical protein GCM10027578_31670 [Spirosoma luteolum]
MRKKIGVGLLIGLVLAAIWQRELISYGWMQARGQLRIIWNTQPVADLMASRSVPDSLKQKIRLIEEMKRFSVDSLGLDPSGSYTSFYDQHGKPILWVVTAAQPYALVARTWDFPILGTFSYKGFFEKDRADTLVADLKREGLDTRIGEVSAWSTLGFLNDPILSSMLDRPVGSLAELIFHELTHGTLFVKDNLAYNENLADFVGEYGALRFLAARYGKQSTAYRDYLASKDFYNRYDEHVLRGTRTLDTLYRSFKPDTPISVKDSLKWQTIDRIVATADTLTDERSRPSARLLNKPRSSKLKGPNNAYFIGFLTYRNQQNRFRREFETQFGGNFTRYLCYLKETYPSL